MKKSPSIASGALGAVAVLLLACGGQTGGSGSGSLSGTVAGTTFQVASSLAIIGPASSSEDCSGEADGGESCTSSSSGQIVAIELTNRSDATCEAAQMSASGGGEDLANLDGLIVGVVNATGTVATGTYDIVAADAGAVSGAVALFATTNASCGDATELSATSGTVTLTQIGSASVSGSYDVIFGSQGSFSGSFDIAVCDLPDSGTTISDGGTPACKP